VGFGSRSWHVHALSAPIGLGCALAAALLFGSGCASSGRDSGASEAPASLAEQAGSLLSEAIRIRTVNPPGDEKPLAERYARFLSDRGIEAQVVATPDHESQIGRAAVWGRVPGTGAKRPIVLLSHLDVVPATGRAWKHDPFSGTREGAFVIGRGALDAKGISVVHLLAMQQLAARPTPLARDVIFLATPDEESGGRFGSGTVTAQRADLLGNAEYLLTEGGGILIRGDDEPRLWRIGVVEKSPCWLEITSHGTPGHSSVPPRDAAVPRLIAALDRVTGYESPVRVVPEVARMYAAMASMATEQDAAGYADLSRTLEDDPEFRNRFMTLPFQAALVTNTLTITVLQGSSRTNVVPAEAVGHVDARLLPGESCEHFTEEIRARVADPGIAVEPLLSFTARSSPTETPLFRAIEKVAGRGSPKGRIVPSVTVGFTDAHYFRDLGIVAYGFTPRALRREDGRGVHGDNERAAIATLGEAVETLVTILAELDRSDRASGD